MSGMTVNARNPGEDMTTTPPQRIGGWLLGPLAWLLVALLSASLALLLYVMALATPQTSKRLADRKPVIYCYGAFHLLPLSPCGTIPCG